MNRRNIVAILGGTLIGAFLARPTPTEAAPNEPIIVDTEWFDWVGKSGKIEGKVNHNIWRQK